MPLGDLQGFLPAVGVVLPPGSQLQGGTLSANLTLSGPVDKLVVAGPVNMQNAKLAGFSLKSKLGALSSFTGSRRRAGIVLGHRDSDAQRHGEIRSNGNED